MDKAAFHKMTYGMYIVSSRKKDSFNGQDEEPMTYACYQKLKAANL